MHDFSFKRGKLYCENVSVASLVKQHGSPLFVYSHATLTRNFQKLDEALAPVECADGLEAVERLLEDLHERACVGSDREGWYGIER